MAEESVEIGRVSLKDDTDIIVSTGKFKNVDRVDIRKWLKSDKFTGYTKQGISIPKEKWPDVKKLLDKVK
jgi:hypothetical protein